MIPPPNPRTPDGIVDWVTAKVPVDASTLVWVGSGPRWNGLSAAAADVPAKIKLSARPNAATARVIRDLVASTALYSFRHGQPARLAAFATGECRCRDAGAGPGSCPGSGQ